MGRLYFSIDQFTDEVPPEDELYECDECFRIMTGKDTHFKKYNGKPARTLCNRCEQKLVAKQKAWVKKFWQ